MRFDAYTGTAAVPWQSLCEVVEAALPGGRFQPAKAYRPGFRKVLDYLHEDRMAAAVAWDGIGHDRAMVEAKGETTPSVADSLRSMIPAHWCTRADPCQDFIGIAAYESIESEMMAVGVQHRVKDREIASKLGQDVDGKSYYLGGRKSYAQCRLYRKDLQPGYKHLPQPVARLEGMFRPESREARAKFAVLSPEAMWGAAKWSKDLYQRVTGLEVEHAPAGFVWRQPDEERQYEWLLSVGGKVFERLLADHGSPEMVGRQIFEDLKRRREDRCKAK